MMSRIKNRERERERERNRAYEGVNFAERLIYEGERGRAAHVSNVRGGCVTCRCRVRLQRV